MSKQIDFNINNYTIADLEKFLNLTMGYNEFEIKEKERVIRNRLMKAIDNEKSKKKRETIEKNIFQFLDEAKRLLIEKLSKTKIIESEGNSMILIDKNNAANSITSYLQPISTFPTNVAQGNLNTLKRKTSTYSLCMNTLFRDTNGSTASDSLFILPYPMKNVISMKLSSFEFPDTVYMVSEKKRTNRLFIKEEGTNKQGMIVIPEGNYTHETIDDVLQNTINETLDSEERFSVRIDEHSGKTTIKNSEHTFSMQFVNGETNKILSKNLGWALGYRNANYIRSKCYVSESIFCPIPVQYVYFVLNDFNISNSTTIMGIFLDNYVEKNILAKIPIHVDSFQVMFDNNSDLITKKREYYGTVDVNKFSVKILDMYGEVVDMNAMDFSFTLEFEIAYDI
jgi:hypothetical protein